MKDPTPALLRVAARAIGASAAHVVRRDDAGIVAAWPIDAALPAPGAGVASVGVRLADGVDADVIFTDAQADPARRCRAVLNEIARTASGGLTDGGALLRLAETLELLHDAALVLRASDHAEKASLVVFANAAFTRLLGYAPEEIAGRPVSLLWGPETAEDRVRFVREKMRAGEAVTTVHAFYGKDRAPVWLEVTVSPLGDGYFAALYRDVTHRRQFEQSLASQKRKLQTTLAAIADAVITVLDDGRVEFVNAAAQALLAMELADAYGEPLDAVLQLLDPEDVPIDILARANAGGVHRGNGRLSGRHGTFDVAFVASRVEGDHGYVLVLRDVTAEHLLATQLSFEATHDPLTGLPNRRVFIDRLTTAVHDARTRGIPACVAFLDLDHFKVVNDRFGHAVGDRLLHEIGAVMHRIVRGADILARIGGDEFALLLTECKPDDARRVAEKIRASVEAYEIEHDGERLRVGVSIGIATVDARTTAAAQALDDADAACYQAKAAGRNVVAG